MEYISGITEFSYNPIQAFNQNLQNERAFEIPQEDINSFENILESKRKQEQEKQSEMGSFMTRVGGAFSDGLNAVNNNALEAEHAQEILAAGGNISAHEVMIAAEKSNLSLQMAVQIRNRLLNAYTEINSMQI